MLNERSQRFATARLVGKYELPIRFLALQRVLNKYKGNCLMTTLTDATVNPAIVPVGTTATPFSSITASDPLNTVETITITPAPTYSYPYYYYYYTSPGDYGTITDPNGGGSFDPTTHTFTETAVVTGTPTAATEILKRLVYTPPALSNGNSSTAYFNVSVNGTLDPNPVQLETVAPPAITGTVANEPIASGSTIRPFATVQINDNNYNYSAKTTETITLTDGGAATDADGLLTGNGLSKTGVGTYTVSAPSGYYFYGSSSLQNLAFTPTAVAAGATRTTAFDLKVTDVAAGLSTDDKTTSVLVIGPAPTPQPPLIAGTSGSQTVQPGNAISPFNGVTISDTNAMPLDSAEITVTGGGTLAGAGLTTSASAPGVYTVAATSPTGLTTILDNLSFIPPALGTQSSITSNIELDVTDGTQTATDKNTVILEAAPQPVSTVAVPPPPTDFTIADQTTGQQTLTNGDSYTGPITGITRQVVLITPDKLNITATAPNVFIHSGSGDDAINVSKAGGNNILDGSTGSNFLTGGTGNDTFYLDDRGPAADVYSTVVGFHSGDNASVFGVSLKDFTLTNLDNQGAVGFKGLDFQFTAAGKPTASLVLTGYTTADVTNGRLTVSYGTEPDAPGVPGSSYLNIHGN